MENNQVTVDEVLDSKLVEQPKPKKETPFLTKISNLEKQVARLEKQIDIIIKSLRR